MASFSPPTSDSLLGDIGAGRLLRFVAALLIAVGAAILVSGKLQAPYPRPGAVVVIAVGVSILLLLRLGRIWLAANAWVASSPM